MCIRQFGIKEQNKKIKRGRKCFVRKKNIFQWVIWFGESLKTHPQIGKEEANQPENSCSGKKKEE